jgi:glycosyltransferase involved in cell wall biosynthesis
MLSNRIISFRTCKSKSRNSRGLTSARTYVGQCRLYSWSRKANFIDACHRFGEYQQRCAPPPTVCKKARYCSVRCRLSSITESVHICEKTVNLNGAGSRDTPRILHFLCTPVRAGVGEHALSLLIALRKFGLVPYIVAPSPLLDAAKAELDDFGINSVAMDMSSPLDWREIVRLSYLLRQEQIDIVHCHMAIASACASPIAWLSGVPALIETTHGREIWREGKHLRGYFWVDRQVGRLTDRFIAVSEAVARHLIENKRVPAHKITVIRNGRDLSRFHPVSRIQTIEARAELNLGKDPPVILMLARFSVEKGHQLLIDAVRQLVEHWPRLVVLLAGDGPLEQDIKTQSTEFGLNDNVRFLGYRSDTQKLFAASDVVVLPSKIEGLPLVAVEALASGRPVVATAVGGTPEVVIDHQTGLLAPPEDPSRFAEALNHLLSDPGLRTRMGTRGRSLVEERFDVRVQVQQTVALYSHLLNASHRSSPRRRAKAFGTPASVRRASGINQ